MSIPSSSKAKSLSATRIGRALYPTIRVTYDIAMVLCGQVVVEHDTLFGNLRESGLESEETSVARLTDAFRRHLMAFEIALSQLELFNSAFISIRTTTGLETAGNELSGYLLGGPMDRLLRALRRAFSNEKVSEEEAKELARNVSAGASELENAMEYDSEDDRMCIYKLANVLKNGEHHSLEQVISNTTITSTRRDVRALVFVALAIAGWAPDLDGWERHIANLIRGESVARGTYHLPLPLEHKVRNDILVGVSLERQDTYMTLNGLYLKQIESIHVGQSSEGRYVRAMLIQRQDMVSPLWARYECTPDVEWDIVKDFVSQARQMTHGWTSVVKRLSELGMACVYMNGMEAGRAFLAMSDNLKLGSPGLYKVWEKTMSQRSFTALVCSADSCEKARNAILERLILSTVTQCSRYQIFGQVIHLKVKDRTAHLFDEEGKKVYVDEFQSIAGNEDIERTARDFFALLARAMEGWLVKLEFYKDTTYRKMILEGRALGKGFYRLHEHEKENRAAQAWQRLSVSLFDRKK